MLNYEEFKKEITEGILGYLPEKYQGYEAKVIKTYKINETIDSISIFSKETPKGYSPSFNINELYNNQYISGVISVEDILHNLSDAIDEAYENVPSFIPGFAQKEVLFSADNQKDKIILQLINTEKNLELLSTLPHRSFQDLSIIYRVVAHFDADGISSVILKNEFAEKLQMTEEELFALAIENTKKILVPRVRNMQDIIMSMMCSDNPLVDEEDDLNISGNPMFVITNSRGISGASSMLYEDVMQTLAEKLDSNLYILPSSVHEVLAIPAKLAADPTVLSKMVQEVNENELAPKDFLSSHVYLYDKDTRRLTIAI